MAESFVVKEVVEETITLAKLGLNHRVEFTVDACEECTVYGYEKEFFQALINIVNNAIDQLIVKKIDSPKVAIRVEKSNGNCRITVKDNAGGIEVVPPDSVFYPYKSTKGRKGSGMGLYITKHIIEDKMNGKISVANSNTGACFTLNVPTDTIMDKTTSQ